MTSGRAGHGFTKTNINDSFQFRHAADLYETLYRLFETDRRPGAPMDEAVARLTGASSARRSSIGWPSRSWWPIKADPG